MKAHPILFSTEMVQAILAGRKEQTRRVISFCKKADPEFYNEVEFRNCQDYKDGSYRAVFNTDETPFSEIFPYGKIGDILWVRETWQHHGRPDISGIKYIYKADKSEGIADIAKWKPCIFMPKEACRIFLKITNIRVERLQAITQEDALKEGIKVIEPGEAYYDYQQIGGASFISPRGSYVSLWQKINGAESWDANPWVWVISFERIEKPEIF
jgi:hypothetical protein